MLPSTLLIWIHLVAAVAWVGGMIFHRLVLRPSLAGISPPAKGQDLLTGILVRMDSRYKTLRWLSLATLLVTGIVLLINEGGSARMESAWGAVLMLKLLFVLIVIGLTAIHDVGMAPARAIPSGASSQPPGRASDWVSDTIFALGLVIVLIAAYLVKS
ncbi:MAG: CopD family protein [Nitrospirae bacterium]|nr:CopD family protein [Nitrospirota bacterium]